jgi:peptidylprolyl isomerase
MRRRTFISGIAAASFSYGGITLAATAAESPEDTLILTTKNGPITIRLRPDLAPKHVARIKELARNKFYDGLKFHRVIEGFMAQTGDPRGDGTGGSDLPDLPAEFTQTPFKRGTLGMARAADPDSANSQFFIMFADGDFLNGQYTVFGEVTEGMDVVDRIKMGDPNDNGSVADPDVIVTLRVASDVK